MTDARSVLLLAAVMKGGNPEEVIPDRRPLNPLFVILQPSRQEVEGRVTDGVTEGTENRITEQDG